ncbi:lanthionine synthetase LanC family protein [Bifidobacterium longum]
MSGSAGACAVLASGVLGQDDSTIQITKQLAQRIIRQAVRGDDDTLAWPQKSTGIMLGGFAHGATGIGWALSKTADFTNSDEIHDYAVRALAFDNQFFDKERGLWRDARSTDNAPSYPMRWCHGAPGIIMAQYDSSDYKQQNDFLGTLAKRIIVSPLDSSDCLCHGTLGNWLALKNILSSYEKDAAASDQYLRRVISRIRSEGAKSGILSGQLDSVGLMLGESGWLTALLIKLDPSIPNPLLLELPTS